MDNKMDIFRMVLFMGLTGLVISRSIPLSAEIFSVGTDSGAAIMEVADSEGARNMTCPIDFAKQNYTILTSQCLPPDYNATLCCTAFKQFACPLAAKINDVKNNNCAKLMFKNIHDYGKYEPGTFSSMCRKSKLGLSCHTNTFH